MPGTLLAAGAGALLLLQPCRFTVRDVAFVDLADATFRLRVVADGAALDADGALVSALLLDTNLELDEVPGAGLEVELVHPDGRALTLGPADGGLLDRVRLATHSPLRGRLADELAATYAFVVLALSGERGADERAREAVTGAMGELGAIWDTFPKDVGERPRVLEVGPDQRREERVLLWSLGLDPEAGPAAAVVFGRGRRAGSALAGPALTAASLLAILANVGRSCECELDPSWMQGDRLPLAWDGTVRERAAELLGFDPESPLVRAEVASILARSGGAESGTVSNLLDGYAEVEVGRAEPPPIDPSPEPRGSAPYPPEDGPGGPTPKRWADLLVTAALFVAASLVLGLLVVLLRSRRR